MFGQEVVLHTDGHLGAGAVGGGRSSLALNEPEDGALVFGRGMDSQVWRGP